MIVRQVELEFLEEAIRQFEYNESLATWRDEHDKYIALRVSHDFCRDSVIVLETRKIGTFVNVLPESNTLILSGERD